MYELNITRIESQLAYLTNCVGVLETVRQIETEVEIFAVSRALHIGVECVIDIGNSLIDGFIMRDPGGYADIIDILEDERVVSLSLANKLKEFVLLREKLVRYYDEVEKKELEPYSMDGTVIFRAYISQVGAFIEREKAAGNVY